MRLLRLRLIFRDRVRAPSIVGDHKHDEGREDEDDGAHDFPPSPLTRQRITPRVRAVLVGVALDRRAVDDGRRSDDRRRSALIGSRRGGGRLFSGNVMKSLARWVVLVFTGALVATTAHASGLRLNPEHPSAGQPFTIDVDYTSTHCAGPLNPVSARLEPPIPLTTS